MVKQLKEYKCLFIWGMIDIVIAIIAILFGQDVQVAQWIKENILKKWVVYLMVYGPYFVYFITLLYFTLIGHHKNNSTYSIYFIQILLMTIINNGLLLLITEFKDFIEYSSHFYQTSVSIINSIFIGVLAYLGTMLPKIIKLEKKEGEK